MSLRELLESSTCEMLMEAHNGISAKIVEEAGFKGIWASGLTLSASLGHRDCNEISWSDLCRQLEFMRDATYLPILFDGDSGFGNFNNVRELVKRLCRYGISGVCIEDKLFPKNNSFIDRGQTLECIDRFSGKIKAAKDSQTNHEFCVVARLESFIAGLGLEEALKRGYAYAESGADAILVHSKQATPDEIIQFANSWDSQVPLIIVPTKYPQISMDLMNELGISMTIWANHLLRAAITSMREVASEIYSNQSIYSVSKKVALVEEIFRLTNEDELREAENKYEKKRCFST